ncbi:MAG: unnamed protein product [uncultured Paraburkholderia sp.]|uniref:hypothetical protein n=1 Tax=uncultured Paraburkholderia sp. TaxID=1822466 RepID=UPI002597C1DF|nr:hypothetical protein [uncultured Paraburkholderia sp.]CAH2894608.1 MAG: unnamed protein product [uncultured Paraburkholderia sp.]CAH2939858.1 MAG: unnamed protein product [uncultured Paraburkholderia sp.]
MIETVRGIATTENIKDLCAGDEGQRLLANTASVVAYVPPRPGHFLEANPGLSVDLEERPSSGIVEALVHERAELVSTLMLRTFSHFKRVSSQDRLVVLLHICIHLRAAFHLSD